MRLNVFYAQHHSILIHLIISLTNLICRECFTDGQFTKNYVTGGHYLLIVLDSYVYLEIE